MTRAESDAYSKTQNRKHYLSRRERKLAYQHDYYKQHRDEILAKQREKRRNNAAVKKFIKRECKKSYRPPSTDACECLLPYGLRKKKAALRDEYRKIPITERPPYDYYLRCKTVEYIRNYE